VVCECVSVGAALGLMDEGGGWVRGQNLEARESDIEGIRQHTNNDSWHWQLVLGAASREWYSILTAQLKPDTKKVGHSIVERKKKRR